MDQNAQSTQNSSEVPLKDFNSNEGLSGNLRSSNEAFNSRYFSQKPHTGDAANVTQRVMAARLSAREVYRRQADYQEEEEADYTPSSLRKPFPKKQALIALFLLITGLVFSGIGLAKALQKGFSHALPFVVIGGLSLIPGFFHTVLLVCAYMGRPGYSYDMIPTGEDY